LEDEAPEVVNGAFVAGAPVLEDLELLSVASVATPDVFIVLELSLSFELKILLVASLSEVVIGTGGLLVALVDSVVSDPETSLVMEDEASEVIDGDFVVRVSVSEDPDLLSVASVATLDISKALDRSLSPELKILLVALLSEVVIGTDG